MKKLVIAGVMVTLLGVTSAATAQTPQPNPVDVEIHMASDMPTTLIGNIEVPYEILMYAQMKYQGYAVTQASKGFHGGIEVYRLRVDRDSDPSDYDSFYLLYDMQWQLVGEDKAIAPVAPVNDDKDKKEDKMPDSDDNEGRGGGFDEEGDDEVPLDPLPEEGEDGGDTDPSQEPEGTPQEESTPTPVQ